MAQVTQSKCPPLISLRPFPLVAYQSLHRCMERVALSSRSLYTAILYLHHWAQQEASLHEFRRHVDMIGKMNQHLIQVSSQSLALAHLLESQHTPPPSGRSSSKQSSLSRHKKPL
jgi:hypothetical protein